MNAKQLRIIDLRYSLVHTHSKAIDALVTSVTPAEKRTYKSLSFVKHAHTYLK